MFVDVVENTIDPGTLTIHRFESGDLDAKTFTHEAHIYVARLYLCEFENRDAIERFDRGLRRLVIKLGAKDKYNAMITWLFMKLIAERMRKGESWETFRERNADLVDERPPSS